jgi:predicted enzyme related to lactoylglutathione lyase
MRARDTSAGAPCWMDLNTSDSAVARDFYTGLFGWGAGEASPEFGGYFMFMSGEAPVAGCMPAMAGGAADVWSIYLTSEDAQRTVDAATSAGGQVVVPPMAVADLGTMGMVLDPGGAAIGLWQPGQFAGMQQVGDPGQPSWFELHTRDYDKALDFYRDVFGWTTEVLSDQPGMRYTVLSHGGNPLAGVMDASGWGPEEPMGWWVYVWVEDADETLKRVIDLGGSVIRPAEDTPYGRLATAADPEGAVFKLMAANDQMPNGGA